MSHGPGGVTTLLQVYDMPASLAFYCGLLGFRVLNHAPLLENGSFHWVWLQWGDAALMLNTAYEFDHERPVPPDAARVAAHGDTGLYFACADVDAVYATLRGHGLDVSAPVLTSYNMKCASLRDPDGYSLNFQQST